MDEDSTSTSLTPCKELVLAEVSVTIKHRELGKTVRK